jgi:CO/xanthine dehydrogenase FAD-binding subunit
MLLNLTEYYRPATMAEALALLACDPEHTLPLAGGTHLLGQRNDAVRAVVDLSDLGLDGIAVSPAQEESARDGQGDGADLSPRPLALPGRGETQVIRLGAMVTLQTLATHPLLLEVADGIVAQAAHCSATRLIRNAATVGGTLAIGAAATADLPAALLALDARLTNLALRPVARSSHMQTPSPISPFPIVAREGSTGQSPLRQPGEVEIQEVTRAYADVVERPARAGELIIAVSFPWSVNARAAFLRVSRTPTDFALVNVATVVEFAAHPTASAPPDGAGSEATRVRVAIGGEGMHPVRLTAIETALTGKILTAERIATTVETVFMGDLPPALAAASDFLASNAYRRAAGKALVRRALEQCLGKEAEA